MVKRCGLSRSTLLYYHRIALLVPSERSAAGYRLYSEADLSRLQRIQSYRQTGLSLEKIAKLLSVNDKTDVSKILDTQLNILNQEIQLLREQQRAVIDMLDQAHSLSKTRVMDKQAWVGLLKKTGLDESAMTRWHQVFEQTMPAAHQDFLQSLGIDSAEIVKIRTRASKPSTA